MVGSTNARYGRILGKLGKQFIIGKSGFLFQFGRFAQLIGQDWAKQRGSYFLSRYSIYPRPAKCLIIFSPDASFVLSIACLISFIRSYSRV